MKIGIKEESANPRKHLRYIPFKGIIVAIIFISIASFIPFISGYTLVNENNDVLTFIPTKNKTVTIGWVHSVERAPWSETYKVTNNHQLKFKETIYKAYGAGTPDTNSNVDFLNNGFIRVTGIERIIPFYSLYYAPISQYYIEIGEMKYPLKEFVPDYSNVRIKHEKQSIYEWVLSKIILPQQGVN